MTSINEIQGHFGVKEATFGGLDDELGEPLSRTALHFGRVDRRDVGLDGWTFLNPHHCIISHVFVQPFVHISFVQAAIKSN